MNQCDVNFSIYGRHGALLQSGHFMYSLSCFALTLANAVVSSYAGIPFGNKALAPLFLRDFQIAISQKNNLSVASSIQNGNFKTLLGNNRICTMILLHSFGYFILEELHSPYIYLSKDKRGTKLADGNGDIMYFHWYPYLSSKKNAQKNRATRVFHTFFNPGTFYNASANHFDVVVADPLGDGSFDLFDQVKEKEKLEDDILAGLDVDGDEFCINGSNCSFEIWLAGHELSRFAKDVEHATDGKFHIYSIPHFGKGSSE